MKLKRILKIALLIVSIVITGFLVALMYTVFYIENARFEYSMLIPLLIIPTGVLSIIYHFKTLRFYSFKTNAIGFKDVVLWVGNGLLALSLILTSLYLTYSLYSVFIRNQNTELYFAMAICFFMLISGLSLAIEEYHLYKRIVKIDEDLFKGTIDDIKGVDENQD